jgi:peptidoglycan-N-acetylglucosamine deacetylase
MTPYRLTNILFILSLIVCDCAYLFAGASLWWILVVFVIYINLLVLGTIFIRWNYYVRSYNSSRKKNEVALTFDDGPGKETALILDILSKLNVPAAFFTIGKNAAANPEILLRWKNEGHLIGNHSYYHGFNFDWKSSSKMARELQDTNSVVEQITGLRPRLFRPPYGVTNPNLARAIGKTGMQSIGWNIRSFDTAAKDKKDLLDRILFQLQGGDIILLHDTMAITREILTELIVRVQQKGFTFARVDKMLDLEAYA